MAYTFHQDKPRYFDIQYYNSRDYIIPFIENTGRPVTGLRVLEIGCAEGGVLKAFLEKECICTGIELSASRAENAKKFLAEYIENGKATIISDNIYDIPLPASDKERFDLIILKDVIEHIHDQQRIMERFISFLAPGGNIFFGFPPWHMPFGGHQQMCSSRIGALLPWYHLLPMPLYRSFLKMLGETEQKIENLAEIKETGISLRRFETIVRRLKYRQIARTYYLINPIYQWKFNLSPRRQFGLISRTPGLRELFTTGAYYLIGREA